MAKATLGPHDLAETRFRELLGAQQRNAAGRKTHIAGRIEPDTERDLGRWPAASWRIDAFTPAGACFEADGKVTVLVDKFDGKR